MAATHRGPEPERILNGAGETHAADEPQETGRVAELRGEHGADERPGAGNRGEMVAEEHPPRRRKIIRAVVLGVRGRDARIVQHPELGSDEGAVVAVRDDENAKDGDDDVQGTHIKWILAGSGIS